MYPSVGPWTSRYHAAQGQEGEPPQSDLRTLDKGHDLHVPLQRDQLDEGSVGMRGHVGVCGGGVRGGEVEVLGQ